MAKHYPDRGEDFSPAPELPDELKICGECEYYAYDQPICLCAHGGQRVRGAQCLYQASGCTDFETGNDILDGVVFVPFTGRPCSNFEPCAEALAAAAEAAEYERNPYAANGVDQRDFY